MEPLEAVETSEKMRSGNAIPTPKNKKRRRFPKKSIVDTVLVKRTAMNKGLQGITIAPKKKPNKNALIIGFLTTGARVFGRNLPMSISNISNKLTIISMPNAIGEIISITLVREIFKIVVKISPNNVMNRTTPKLTISPNNAIVFLPYSVPDNWFDRYTRKPGYKGKTQAAVNGVSRPNTNASEILARYPIGMLTTLLYIFKQLVSRLNSFS